MPVCLCNINTLIIDRKDSKMTTISTEQNVVTLVNVFTVGPEDQRRLVDEVAEEADRPE